MRKFILIAAMVLISASAQAGASLTVASNDEPAAEQPKTGEATKTVEPKTETPRAEASKAEAPKFVERPAAVDATPPKAEPAKSEQTKPAFDKKAEKTRHKHESTEARVIYELHRHGIYW
jgi:hypothetical protein